MLNRVILMGRITQDLDLKSTPSGAPVLTFTIAVERSFAKQGEERQADFITCVAWRKQAEFICKHFAKGRMIAIEGNLRTRNYEDRITSYNVCYTKLLRKALTRYSLGSAFYDRHC